MNSLKKVMTIAVLAGATSFGTLAHAEQESAINDMQQSGERILTDGQEYAVRIYREYNQCVYDRSSQYVQDLENYNQKTVEEKLASKLAVPQNPTEQCFDETLQMLNDQGQSFEQIDSDLNSAREQLGDIEFGKRVLPTNPSPN